MERKENDLMLNISANPGFTIADFSAVGLNIDNTSLQDKEQYRNHPIIQEKFTDEEGKFNDYAFTQAYNQALIGYNQMATDSFDKETSAFLSAHRDDIFSKPEYVREGPDIKAFEHENPDKLTSSLINLGEIGPRTKSQSELAQGEKVLLNPIAVEKGAEPIWDDAPEDSFWKYFDDTLVLAQYDEDVINEETGEVNHKKGEYKIGPGGTYYYETLDGRDGYGRNILNKMDVFTKEGSWWNQYDFFDSDDINQKNAIGSTMKNLALVGTMFLPYVGPYVAALSLATQLSGLMGTLGKMITSSEVPFFNELESWSKTIGRSGHTTEYAKNNVWCWENIINLAGDVAGQVKEQRFIFEKIPAIFTGKYIGNDQSMKKLQKAFETMRKKEADEIIEKLPKNQIARIEGERIKATLRAQADMESFVKNYNKLGAVLGKGYMTTLVTLDTYNEAKHAGATDTEAVLLTLGYAAAEYALLSSSIGSWMMPELRNSKIRNQAIIKAITKIKQESPKTSGITKNTLKKLDKESKKDYVKRLFKTGKEAAEEAHATYASTGKGFLKASGSAGLAEGLEETSEELLADFAKGCYNIVNWLQEDTTRMSSFGFNWTNGERSWSGKDLIDRYGMSFVGGFIGGGFANAKNNYRMANSYANMNSKQAMEQLVYIGRNEGFGQFRKDLQKFDLPIANKYLSPEFIESNGLFINPPGTKRNNQDTFVKEAVNKQLDIIENLLSANGAVSDEEFLDIQTLKDLRFNQLQQSVTAGRYLQRFNSLYSNIIQTTDKINTIISSSIDGNKNGKVEDNEKRHNELSESQKKEVDILKKELKSYQSELQDLTEGKLADEFISDAMFEMNTYLQNILGYITLPMYVKKKYGKDISNFNKEELNDIYKEFKNYKTDNWDDMASASKIFRDIVQIASDSIKQNEQQYINDSEKQFRDKLNLLLQSVILNSEDALSYQENVRDYENYGELINSNPEFLESLYSEIKSLITNSVEEGGLNFEVKSIATNILDKIQTHYLYLREEYLNTNIFEDTTPYDDRFDEILSLQNQLKQIGNTPIFKSLNEFNLSLGNESVNIQQVLQTSESLLKEKLDQLSEFSLSNLEAEIENALKTLRIYKAAVLAASTDSANLNNLFGYNATLNEVTRKMGKDAKLAEIDSKYANLLVSDIEVLEHKLQVLENLHRINQSQKLYKQDRVTNNVNILLYNKIRYIVNIPDNHPVKQWEGYQKFVAIIKAQKTLSDLSESNNRNISLTIEEQAKIEKERIQIEDAIHEFFNNNAEKLSNPEQLAQIIGIYDVYTNSEELLTENLNELDGPSFIWYLASRVATKSSAFHSELNTILDPVSKIASIFPQELAIYNNYASIINGNIYTNFFNAYRTYLKQNWKNKKISERESILKKLDIDTAYASDKWSDYVFNIIPSPKYQNITLTEGIPGSGKTSVVFKFTIDLLRKYHPEYLANAYVVHGADLDQTDNKGKRIVPKQGTELQKNLGIEGKVLTIQELLKKISVNYSPRINQGNTISFDSNDFYLNEDKDIISSQKVSIQDAPSIIIIDEVTKFSDLELTIIDKFAKENGITVIAAGDYDQIGVSGEATIKIDDTNVNITLASERNKFSRVPKLGVSMRIDNSLKARNQAIFQEQAKSKGYEKTILWYDEDESGLYGDKVINNKENISTVTQEVDKLIKTLDPEEKIGFIYFDKNSKIYEELNKSPYKQHIEFMEGGTAQGSEGRYYIIDTPSNVQTQEQVTQYWKQAVYTGLSRAKQGSLILIDGPLLLLSDKVSRTDASLSKRAIEEYNIKRKQRLEEIGNERTESKKRTAEKDNTTQPSSQPKANPTPISDIPPPQKENSSDTDTSIVGESDPNKDQDQSNTYVEHPNFEKDSKELHMLYKEGENKLIDLYNGFELVYRDDVDEIEKCFNKDLDAFSSIFEEIHKELDIAKQAYENSIQNADKETIQRAKEKYIQTVKDLKESLTRDLSMHYMNNSFQQILDERKNRQLYSEEEFVYDDTDNTSIDNKLEEQVLKESIEQQPIPELDQQTTDSILLKMWLFSFNTFELGVMFDDNGKMILNEHNKHRLDSVNGLIKLGILNENSTKSDCEKIISKIRNSLFNIKDKAELIQSLNTILGNKGIFINFAIKNHYITNKEYDPNSYGNFILNPNEEVLYHGSLGGRSNIPSSRKIVALIGTEKTGEVLEIPLLTLTSPFTLAMTKVNGEYVYPLLANLMERYMDPKTGRLTISQGKDKYKLLEDMALICHNNPSYKNMANWIELYLFTYGAIFRINDPNNPADDWTIAKNLKNKGSHITIEAGTRYDEGAMLTTNYNALDESEWINVSSLLSNPSVRVTSKIYKSKTGRYKGKEICHAGHSFVLVSHDTSLNTDSKMIKQYLKQCEDDTVDKKVALYYVLPPRVSFEKYITNLNRLLYTPKASSTYSPYHSEFASYRILSILTKHPEFRRQFENNYPGLLNILDPIISNKLDTIKDSAALKAELMKKVKFGNDAKEFPLVTHFNHILTAFVYGKDSPVILLQENYTPTLNQERVDLINSILDANNFKLYHNVQIDYNAEEVGGVFIPVFQDANYMIDGEYFKIHGKIDSYEFEADMSDIMENIINNKLIVESRDGNYFKRSRDTYIPSEYRRQKLEEASKQTEYSKRLNEIYQGLKANVQQIPNIEINNFLTQEQLNESLKFLCNFINKNTDRIALQLNDKIILSNPSKLFSNIESITSNIEENPKDFTINIYKTGESISYQASYENGDLLLYIDSNDTQNTDISLSINQNNFESYKTSAQELFTKGVKGLRAFKELFQAKSFEEFQRLLKYLQPSVGGKRKKGLEELKNLDISENAKQIVDELISLDNKLSQSLDSQEQCIIPQKIKTTIF